MPKEVLFKLVDVTKKFGKAIVLDKINLEIPPGKIFGIIGPSGAGKTTLLRLLVTFYTPSKGKIYFGGEKLKWKKIRHLISMSAQHGSFYPNLTVEQNIAFFGKLYGLSKDMIKRKALPLLKELELYDKRNIAASALSKGMQKRLDIICTLLPNAEIFIFDEPMEDLDPLLREKVVKIIKKLHKQGKSIIICSHFFKELEELCEEIIMLYKGKIIEAGSLEEIEEKYGHLNLEKIFFEIVRKKKFEEKVEEKRREKERVKEKFKEKFKLNRIINWFKKKLKRQKSAEAKEEE
ncbi:MAG: ABC transporter ATP-binding protein [Candidatus Pacearchaeota archaeon]